jgi:acyl transferase domain-containing protein
MMQSVAGGAMLSVVSSEDALTPLLSEQLAVAAVNGPSNCVVSGPTGGIEKLELVLQSRGIDHRRLHVSHAFHSASMDAILDSFTEQVQAIRLNAPEVPFISNLTGTWITEAEARSAAYWTAHLRHPVRFSAGLTELLQDPARVFLEVGPGASLNQLLRQQKTWTGKRVGLASLRSVRDRETDEQFVQRALGKLWLAGARIDWGGFYAQEDRRHLSLPAYPFERQRYWVEPQRSIKRTEISENGSHAVQQIDDSLHYRPELAVSYQPAGNEIERKLALIWQQLLGIESIGSNDDFFELGGHSLLATQVATRIRSAFNIELPVGTLFELPTIRKLAPLIFTKLCERTEAEELEQMLAAIRNLSALEVQSMLAAERAVH